MILSLTKRLIVSPLCIYFFLYHSQSQDHACPNQGMEKGVSKQEWPSKGNELKSFQDSSSWPGGTSHEHRSQVLIKGNIFQGQLSNNAELNGTEEIYTQVYNNSKNDSSNKKIRQSPGADKTIRSLSMKWELSLWKKNTFAPSVATLVTMHRCICTRTSVDSTGSTVVNK